jgi:hypothetical protein
MSERHRIPYPTKPIEIMPAALLSQKDTWHPIIQALPANTCLLVSNLNHPRQNALIFRLSQSFRRKGTQVFVLSVSP